MPGTAVLVLSQYVEETYASDLLADGAGGVGYLLKDRVSAPGGPVRRAGASDVRRNGRRPRGGGQLFARRRDPLDALTAREREVLGLMAEGRTNSAIARALVITDGAVEKHISSILTKLDLPPSNDDHRRVMAVLAWLKS